VVFSWLARERDWLPTSTCTLKTPPLYSAISSAIRSRKRSRTQSITKRLGARSRSICGSWTACSGRNQVLNCWADSSSSSRSKHLCQTLDCISVDLNTEQKEPKSIRSLLSYPQIEFIIMIYNKLTSYSVDKPSSKAVSLPPFCSKPPQPLKIDHDETHFSAQCNQTQAYTRIPCPDENKRWTTRTRIASSQGPRPIGRLILIRAGYGLPKSRRLLRPTEYAATQRGGQRWRDELVRVYAVSNPHPYGRLGIVISRRVAPRAVTRNRVKRQIRESFRHNQIKLSGLDIVVVANPMAAVATAERIRSSLQQMWEIVEQQCKKS